MTHSKSMFGSSSTWKGNGMDQIEKWNGSITLTFSRCMIQAFKWKENGSYYHRQTDFVT